MCRRDKRCVTIFGGLEGASGRDLNKQEPAFLKKYLSTKELPLAPAALGCLFSPGLIPIESSPQNGWR